MEVEYDQQPTMRDKELAWKIKRSKNITSSCIKKLSTGGRKKGEEFGLTSISYINEIVTQIIENDIMDNNERGEIWQMQFGKDNEPLAINWWRENFMEEIKCGSTDFDEILFLSPFEGFSDSPDGLVYESDETVNWCEIKCPANKTKACNLTDGSATLADVVDEYRDQFIGHFLGLPNSELGYYVIFNAHVNELTGKPYNRGVRFILKREDFEPSITQTERKIEKVYEFIKLCVAGKYKPEDVNEWWGLNGKEE
jgi:hypothetical protein